MELQPHGYDEEIQRQQEISYSTIARKGSLLLPKGDREMKEEEKRRWKLL